MTDVAEEFAGGEQRTQVKHVVSDGTAVARESRHRTVFAGR